MLNNRAKSDNLGTESPFSDTITTGYFGLDFNNIEQYDSETLLSIDARLQGSEMSKDERLFLNGIIRKTRPQKIVEYGVAAGGSAAVILNAIKDIPDAKLYSLDYSERYYQDTSKPVGWMIPEQFPHLMDKWECLSGGVCCRFLDRITNNGNDKIDVCLIDTVHSNPGEFLNILEVLPYMKRNSIIVLHDTAMHTLGDMKCVTNCICLNTFPGKRIVLLEDTSRNCPVVSNIGGIVLDNNVAESHYPLFTNLSLPWEFSLRKEDYDILLSHFQKHYPATLTTIFEKTYRYYGNRYTPLSVRVPFVRWYSDEVYHHFKVFGFTFRIKRGRKGIVRRLAERTIGR